MKSLFALVCLLGLAAAAFAGEFSESFVKFHSFKQQHGKAYKTLDEEATRFEVFSENLKRIEKLNQQYGPDTVFGATSFADLHPDEFKRFYLGTTLPQEWKNMPFAEPAPKVALPESFDWREKGVVTPVKNQGMCGSCWSFSATGAMEGAWALSGKPLVSLSEQNLVDCDHECMIYEKENSCDAGCNGGLMPNAFTWVIKNGGINSEEQYPYQGRDGQCRFDASKTVAKFSNWTMVSSNEVEMANYLIQHGPIAIAADANMWQFYMGGVFTLPCGKTLNHGILIVGFGHKKSTLGKDHLFWIVKNSWGSGWGEKGYILLERGVDKCGCSRFNSVPII